mmetsp:Transcript_26757/g.44878  ORF Transcript_26757/g.44878 Transcript_26757/m.44878 type:complete len:316 (-) Transcript_26757:27-974(-)
MLHIADNSSPASIPERTQRLLGTWHPRSEDGMSEIVMLSFEDARCYVQNECAEWHDKNKDGWKRWCLFGGRPGNIPGSPDKFYAQDWKGWEDWLGKEPRTTGPRVTDIDDESEVLAKKAGRAEKARLRMAAKGAKQSAASKLAPEEQTPGGGASSQPPAPPATAPTGPKRKARIPSLGGTSHHNASESTASLTASVNVGKKRASNHASMKDAKEHSGLISKETMDVHTEIVGNVKAELTKLTSRGNYNKLRQTVCDEVLEAVVSPTMESPVTHVANALGVHRRKIDDALKRREVKDKEGKWLVSYIGQYILATAY